MIKEKYVAYVDLMLRVLPCVAKEACFSLKGGTAINLFVRDMPRLSIDIDLAYVGLEPRVKAIASAEAAVKRIKGFLVYSSSHNRPLPEVINPTIKNMKEAFYGEFEGMTNVEFSYSDFEKVRKTLIADIQEKLSDDQRKYLRSLQIGEPEWNLLDVANISSLPAVQWKLENIQRMNPERRAKELSALTEILKL